MRILMLTCFPTIQGPFPKILPLLAEAVRGAGCEVETEPWGRHSDAETLVQKVFARPFDILRAYRRVRREPFDVLVIHTTTEWPNYSRDIPVLALCRHLATRTVLQFHGSLPQRVMGSGDAAFKRASRAALRLADAVLVLSSEEQRQWKQFCPEANIFLNCNPFRSSADREINVPPPYPRKPDVPILLFTGRLLEQKGVLDLIDALALLPRETPFHLAMAGAGPMEQELRNRAQAAGLAERLTLTGYLSGDQLLAAYRGADLFVFPSWFEGFPTVVAEAMDAGLPVITTHIRGLVDHLQEGVHAWFVPPKSPAQLAAAIGKALADRDARVRMGEANRKKVREFSPEAVARDYVGTLGKVLMLPRRAARASAQGVIRPAAE